MNYASFILTIQCSLKIQFNIFCENENFAFRGSYHFVRLRRKGKIHSLQSTHFLINFESDCKPRLLSKTRKNDQSICRKKSSGKFECPELKQDKVVIAIQRDFHPLVNFGPLPDFDIGLPVSGKEDWEKNYPAIKIHSSGKSS